MHRCFPVVSRQPSRPRRLGYCYDWSALSAELAAAGFVGIRRCEAGQSDDPAFRGLEHRHEPTEAATELIVEARKPGIPGA